MLNAARRRALVALGAILSCRPIWALAQSIPRIAFVSTNGRADSPEPREAFLQGLREQGYVEGRSITIEWRFAERRPERLSGIAAEIVASKPRLIVAETTPAVRAVKQATSSIPIVMTAVADAVGSGLVASLARPGANVTGMSFLGTELVAKRLELLKQALPAVKSVAALHHAGAHGEATVRRMHEETDQAARALGLAMSVLSARSAADLPPLFEKMSREINTAVLVWPSPMFLAERSQIVRLAAAHKVPAIYYLRNYVDVGGLMSYGPNFAGVFRRSAAFVDKILKGAKPGDLPIEQPATFEFVVNLIAASALGVSIPESVLLRADGVVRR
jgi:putative tryptophan/tyrosine transport system substrate-binding protein